MTFFETRISKCVTNMVRHRDHCEREDDGAMHWDNILPVLKGRFQNQLEREFTNEDWLLRFYNGSFKTRSEICKNENGELRYNRAIQGPSGGRIISPRQVHYQIHWRPEQDAVYWIHLSIAHYAGLEFGNHDLTPLLRTSLCRKNAS